MNLSSILNINVREMLGPGGADASVSSMLDSLSGRASGSISGQEMLDLIKSASDYGQINMREWEAIYDWAKDNFSKLSPEAQQVFTKLDQTIQEKGRILAIDDTAVLCGNELTTLMRELESLSNGGSTSNASAPTLDRPLDTAPAGDASAASAIERLLTNKGAITGDSLLNAIRQGTADLDSQAAGAEFDLFSQLANLEGHRFVGNAKDVMAIYERYANKAREAGQTGITLDDWNAMIAEMETVVHGNGLGEASGTAGPATANAPAKPAAPAESDGSASGTPAKGTKGSAGTAPATGSGNKNLASAIGEAGTTMKRLTDQIAGLDPKSETYREDLARLQEQLYEAKERLQLLSQLMQSLHEMNMSVIKNIR